MARPIEFKAVAALTGHDFGRIEMSLRDVLKQFETRIKKGRPVHPDAISAMKRTLEKIERINGTGPYTEQGEGGPTLKERQELNRARRELKRSQQRFLELREQFEREKAQWEGGSPWLRG